MTKFSSGESVMERPLFKFLKTIAYGFVVQAVLYSFAEAKDEYLAVDLFGPDCLEYLLPAPKERFSEKVHLVSRFQKFRIGRQPRYRGFYVEPREPNFPPKVRNVRVKLDQPLIKGEAWTVEGYRPMYFVSTGFHNLEPESKKINSLIADHVVNHAGEGLRINFDMKRGQEEMMLYDFRWNVHDAVMAVYADKKGYLEPDDFAKLIAYNLHSSHNDVFSLMYTPPSVLPYMRYEDILPEMAMTIQISYYGLRNYIDPSLKGVLAARGFGYYEAEDRLPFEYLIPDENLKAFREKFYAQFDAPTTCEMNRYIKLQSNTKYSTADPTDVHSLFLLRAIGKAKDEGMKTIVAVGDKNTMVIWRRYGFKLWGRLPTEGEAEYLMYLEVESSQYIAFYNRLMLRSEEVKLEQIR